MRVILRTAIGMALFAGGLTFLTYGIAQAIEIGGCGTDEYGRSIGPACPSGFAPMILLMVFGTFGAIIGAAIASSIGGVVRFVFVLLIAVPAAVVLGIVDLNPDDSRPGYEVVAATVIPILLLSVPSLGRSSKPGSGPALATPVVMAATPGQAAAAPFVPVPVTPAAPATPVRPTTPADAEEIASRLRQLEQLKESGLLSAADYDERRRQILSEL